MRRPWVKYPLLFVGLIAAYLLFALVSSLMPNGPIIRHAAKTQTLGDLQSDFAFAISCRPEYYMDNFTDALIINQACHGGKDSLLTNMLLVPRADGGGEQCNSLQRLTHTPDPSEEGSDTTLHTIHYGRYWHGSTFLMRFLLLMADYTSLRPLFYLLSSLLLVWLVVALFRRCGLAVASLFVLALTLVNVFIMQFSIQLLPVLALAMIGSLVVLNHVKKPSQLNRLLFVLGSLTAFFDLLTCPMLTWGIPLCVYLIMQWRHPLPAPFLRRVKDWTVASLLWVVSYGTTWVSKWGIATLLTGENVIRDGASQLSVRAGAYIDYSRLDALTRNLDLLPWSFVCITLIILLVLALWRFNRGGLPTALLCLLTALPPLAWYLVAADHSYLHYWFTYRSLAVPLMAIFFAVASLVDWRRIPLHPKHPTSLR